MPDTKACPLCGEEIQAVAIKCRHCGEFLDGRPRKARPASASSFAPCPKCGERAAEAVGFTWWGGVLGPRMLTHVRCAECRTEYNGKTGQSNSTAIAIYTIVGLAIGIGLAVVIIAAR